MKTPQTILASWGTAGPWHIGPPAPNGSVPGQRERYLTEYELYTADYYGTGAHRYLTERYYLQCAEGCRTWINSTQDGHQTRIADTLAACGLCDLAFPV